MAEESTRSSKPYLPPAALHYLFLIGLLWLVGLGITLVLHTQQARFAETGRGFGLPGCSADASGCNAVLQSGYGKISGIPITSFGFLYYGVVWISLVSLFIVRSRPISRYLALELPMISFLGLVTGAWAWYTMKTHIGEECPWCLSVHALNLVIFLLAIRYAALDWKRFTEEVDPDPIITNPKKLVAVAVCVTLGLGAWQWFFLATFNDGNKELTVTVDPTITQKINHKPIDVVRLDSKAFDQDKIPVIWTTKGNRESENVIVMYSCLSCGLCKDVNDMLRKILEDHPGDLRVDMRFNPLWPDCNPLYAKQGTEPAQEHKFACQLTKAAIAVAIVQPESYSDYVNWVYDNQEGMSGNQAYQEARRLVGKEKFDEAVDSEAVKERMERDMDYSIRLDVKSVPQIFMQKGYLGGTITRLKLERYLREAFSWEKPDPAK